MRWLATHHLLGIPDQVARFSRSFVRHYEPRPNPYDIHTNGEALVVDRVVSPSSVVFDVGANVGDWTALAHRRGATVHSFEISPTTASALAHRFGGDARVSTHPLGLSDHDGELRMYHYPDAPVLSTTVAGYPHGLPYEELVVPVARGEKFAGELGIGHIDLLKIDVEGAESAVLEGFRTMLEAGSIDVIQFEYGLVAVIDKFLVRDFYEMLEPLGFLLGPVTPQGVVFQDYDVRLELFEHVNWVAVRRDRPDLICVLRAGQST